MASSTVSKCTVFPDQKSSLTDLKLSVSDLPMLSCHYIQKGCLFTKPPFTLAADVIPLLMLSLSRTLTQFPPLAGRLVTDSDGYVFITCNDAGVDFIHANGSQFHVSDLLVSVDGDLPEVVKGLFAFDQTVSYNGHFGPILAVKVTELDDGVFIGCSANHAVVDGTSFWNFFNVFADLSRGVTSLRMPDFSRDSVFISPALLRLPVGGPKVSFSADVPVREKVFSFSGESILKLKAQVNNIDHIDAAEFHGKRSNDRLRLKIPEAEISSFQSLSALLWRGVTRARRLPAAKMTTFRMAVNCRHRLQPKLAPLYFGNAIQSIPTHAATGDVLGKGLRWCAEQLNGNVASHGDATVRRCVAEWERDPQCFPLGNFDGGMITMGSSPRFPMYDNDFGWGRPVAIRSGGANKFDGKISAFPGREGGGSVDLEVVLAAETMAGLESDPEFMQYVF